MQLSSIARPVLPRSAEMPVRGASTSGGPLAAAPAVITATAPSAAAGVAAAAQPIGEPEGPSIAQRVLDFLAPIATKLQIPYLPNK